MKKYLKLLIDSWHAPDVESALNQEVGTTSPTVHSDLHRDKSGYSAFGFTVEPMFKDIRHEDLLDPRFWEQFIDG